MSLLVNPPKFSKNTPNKISTRINTLGENTLKTTEDATGYCVAIADEPIDAKVDGKTFFCVRVENLIFDLMCGFTPMEKFDSDTYTFFAPNTLSGCGLAIHDGLFYNGIYQPSSINMDPSACSRATEIIVILTISDKGKQKEIRFLCDGKESDSADGSEHLNGDFLFPVVILSCGNAQIKTITVDPN
jgi:hypothetical protein